MIISLNLPDEIVAFIDRKATENKRSRSAWMTGALSNMQLMDSPVGKPAFARCLRDLVADEAIRLGLPMGQARKALANFKCLPAVAAELPAPAPSARPTPQLPVAPAAAGAMAASPSTPLRDSAPSPSLLRGAGRINVPLRGRYASGTKKPAGRRWQPTSRPDSEVGVGERIVEVLDVSAVTIAEVRKACVLGGLEES